MILALSYSLPSARSSGGSAVHPGAVPLAEAFCPDALAPVGVGEHGRQQSQLACRGVREPGPGPGLLGRDQLGGGLADGQAPAQPGCLVVVIDQHRRPVAVPVQAVEPEGADLLGAAAGVDEQLDGDPHPPGADFLQRDQVPAQLADDLGGQVPGRLTRLRRMRHVPGQRGEIVA